MYRSCNKCIHFHYKIIDLHTEDNEIITKLTQQIKNQILLKYHIFDNHKFRSEVKSHQMGQALNSYTKRLNMVLWHKLDIQNILLNHTEIKNYFHLNLKQLISQMFPAFITSLYICLYFYHIFMTFSHIFIT